jgi:hypothetical protein
MPFSFSASTDTPPHFVSLPGCYAVITNIAAMINVVNGVTQEPTLTVWYAIHASEAAFKAGSTPGTTGSVTITPISPIMPLIEPQLAAVLSAIPGVTGVAAISS